MEKKHDLEFYLKVEELKMRFDFWERLSKHLMLASLIVVLMIITAVFKGMPLNYGIMFVAVFGMIAVLVLVFFAKKALEVLDKDVHQLEQRYKKAKKL